MTYRELMAVVEAKQSNDWNHTAVLRMEIRNAAFGRRRAAQFKDCHPFAAKAKPVKLDRAKSTRLLDKVFGDWRS